ncbi:MAG: hypothetical protein LCH56_06820 [Proteobacteria bacterium]|nr:hypothetical protein [Pseudomonadota bacterium]
MTGPDSQADGAGAPQEGALRNTHFDFQAKVFQAPGACFVLKGKDKAPMFAVEMGAGLGYITLKDLRKTFHIAEGSHDDKLIERAAAGLRHVPDIRPGDEIPNEILNGTASWTVARKHKQIARDRIQVQLLSWMSGKPIVYTTQGELKEIVGKDENKKALKDAFGKAAAALGFAAGEAEKVLDLIETLAREICYVEALRERSLELKKIQRNVEGLTKVYNDIRGSADVSRVKLLMVRGLNESENILNNVDAETADIMNALMSLDYVIKAVRDARDSLHFLLMEWDPVIAKWENLTLVRCQEVDRALLATYKFLASRFDTGKSLMRKSGN